MAARKIRYIVLLACVLVPLSCSSPIATESVISRGDPTATPFQPAMGATHPGGVALEADAHTGMVPASWWLAPGLPVAFLQQLHLPEGAQIVADEEQAHLRMVINQGETISRWIFALVAPFPTITDEISLEDLRAVWRGEQVDSFPEAPLLMTAETQAAFAVVWGEPTGGAVQVDEAAALVEASWAQQAWALVPFEELHPKWKVIAVDGQSPIWKTFDPDAYPLSILIGLEGDPTLAAEALDRFAPETGMPLAPLINREADRLTTVILTGVTALVRATAYEMERSGTTYPAEDIGAFLREADITHISNEVPFDRDCPAPDPAQRTLIFCSDASYIELLEEVGTDVVELTGDHFNDWSRDAMLYTLELYKERGWPYYGGGANIEEARQPLRLEHNGNKIAFIGCNGKGGGYASADVDYPGAAKCDYALMESQVQDLVAQGYLVIATFQHNEVYQFIPAETLVRDFSRISAAGATIVSGSQAHQSHGLEFPRPDAIITYGLGNLFFDQRGVVEWGDRALIARHVFYDGKYVSTELFTIQFVDFAKPRFMTLEERADFLEIIFDASRWDYGE